MVLASPAAHFRAHERRAVRLAVDLVIHQRGRSGAGTERQAVVIDLSLAGAGLEIEEPLTAGDRVSVTLATPTMWDPLVVEAVVAWASPRGASQAVDSLGRTRAVARAGIAFDYPAPKTVLAMFEMLTTLGYE